MRQTLETTIVYLNENRVMQEISLHIGVNTRPYVWEKQEKPLPLAAKQIVHDEDPPKTQFRETKMLKNQETCCRKKKYQSIKNERRCIWTNRLLDKISARFQQEQQPSYLHERSPVLWIIGQIILHLNISILKQTIWFQACFFKSQVKYLNRKII